MDEENQELVEEKGSSSLELTVDEAIEEYVGSFGLSQLLHVFLVSLPWIFDAQTTLVTIFTDSQPDHQWSLSSSSSSPSVCGLKDGAWEWIGGKTSSSVAEFGLICDRKFVAAIPASLYFLGSLFGTAAVSGRLADASLGRRRTLIISCLVTSATAFLCSIAPNVWIYALLRFAGGFSRSGIVISCLALSTETVGRKWRGQVGQYGFFFFTVGSLSLPLIAYPARTCWRNIYRVISVLPLFYALFILLPFVSESPRWLLLRGRRKEALDVLKRYARINGKALPANIFLLESSFSSKKITLWDLKLALVMLTAFGIGFVYYGFQLNVENLNFNVYFSSAMNAMMEIPAVFFGSILLSEANRRAIFSRSAYVAGFSSILCVVFASGEDSGGSWGQLSLGAIGFMSAATAFDVLCVYCVELFPVDVRECAVSMLRQALMLGASMAPLAVAVGRLEASVSFIVFGMVAILSGGLSLWLPETRDSPLFEKLEQQEEEQERKEKPCSAPRSRN